MEMQTNDSFKFFVPVNISKAKDASGKSTMRIGGVASTPGKDMDGEYLDPMGFELDYFKKYGFINWHHQAKNTPAAIIGEPTKAIAKPDGLYIEADLYSDSQLAQDVYSLAKALKANGSKRSLGFSIEGKVLEKDPSNPSHIRKARITGCAVTPTPKSSNTLAEIIKGNYSDAAEEYSTEPNGQGGEEYIINLTRPDGYRITVDSNLNIKVAKALTTETGAALIPEDVIGSVKNLQKTSKKMTKGEVFEKIVINFPQCNISQVKDVYRLAGIIEHLKI